jgi:hypothetical protein
VAVQSRRQNGAEIKMRDERGLSALACDSVKSVKSPIKVKIYLVLSCPSQVTTVVSG